MAYIKFKEAKELVKAIVVPMNRNVIRITTDAEPVLTGFKLYLDKGCNCPMDNGEYESYTTLYRQGEGWYELSNDGSTYKEVAPVQPEEPEPEIVEPEPYVPTLEEIKVVKIEEMNNTQQTVIRGGIDVTLSDGTTEHFTLTDHDQQSLMGLQTQVMVGIEQIPWHNSDNAEHCKYYSNADMATIIQSALLYVSYHVTYFRDLRIYINSLENVEEVEAVTYGCTIPEEYQSEPLKDMLAQRV